MMTRLSPGRVPSRMRDERGAVALFTALTAVILLVVAGFATDIGMTWARRGQLQTQVDQAALLGATYLPANTPEEKARVARAVAWYICKNPVPGQGSLDTSMAGACAAAPASVDQAVTTTSGSFATWAAALETRGLVTFPRIAGSAGSHIRVNAPDARIDFGFGRAAGVPGSNQTRYAVARVGSPGVVSPTSLSLSCLLNAAGNLPAGLGDFTSDLLPLNYIAPGKITPNTPPTKWPDAIGNGVNDVVLNAMPTGTTQGIAPPPLPVSGSGWPLLGLGETKLVFAIGDMSGKTIAELPSAPVLDISLPVVGAVGTVTIPKAVYDVAGTWEVRVATKGLTSTSWKYSKASPPVTFKVELPAITQDLLGCARMIKSPRDLQQGTGGNLHYNLVAGLDHAIATHPHMVSLNPPPELTVPNLLNTLNGGLFSCSMSPPHVMDNGGVHPTPNCVTREEGANTYKEFTDGYLKATTIVPENASTGTASYTTSGRLICSQDRLCKRPPMTVGAFTNVNVDQFSDFVDPARKNLLTESMFFSIGTYLQEGVPVVTPTSAILPDIYRSGRFMWMPVVATPVASNDTGYYPVLTFRPVFITQDVPDSLESVDMILDLTNIVDLWVRTLLGVSEGAEDYGIVLSDDGTELRALRFMTIEPSALPPVPTDWDGPISEYVGVGPRVIRLVR